MKRTHYYALSVLATSLGLASCELEPYEEPVTETYTKAFIKTFGLIDSNQDWNMVTRSEVTVSTETPSRIKVYGLYNNAYRLLGDFADVTGSKTLQFDTPKGVSKLLVSDGTTNLFCYSGGEHSDIQFFADAFGRA